MNLSNQLKNEYGRFANTTREKIFVENCIEDIFKTMETQLEDVVEKEKDRNTIKKVLLKCFKETI